MRAKSSPNWKQFVGLALAWIGGFCCYLVDRSAERLHLPPGVFTVVSESVIGCLAFLSFFRHRRDADPGLRYFQWFFGFVFPADLFYLIVHYVWQLENSTVSFLSTTLLYSTGYVFACLGFWTHIRDRLRVANPWTVALLPLLFAGPVIFEILIPLMIKHYHTGGVTHVLFELAFNSIFAMTFFGFSVLVFAYTLDKVFSFLALGGIILQLGNWGIYSYLLKGDRYNLNEYEFLWLCGIITFAYAVIVVRRQLNAAGAGAGQNDTPKKSLVLQQRQIIVVLVTASILLAVSLSNHDALFFRIAFFGVAVGCFTALTLSEVLVSQIVHYSQLFGRMIHGSKARSFVESDVQAIPVELMSLYRIAFREDLLQERIETAVHEQISRVASQVAHDIRSPLAVLAVAESDLTNLPEDTRLIVRGAIERIQDIANQLLEEYREGSEEPAREGLAGPGTDAPESQWLLSLIEAIVSEKRVQFRSRRSVEIAIVADAAAYGLFARVEAARFKRILSNLLNNSVEAIAQGGRVTVIPHRNAANEVQVRVEDTGKGIPADVLARLGREGETFGKEGGSGLGLYHARSSVEAWGGSLTIESRVGAGTSVVLTLPSAEAPAWFLDQVAIEEKSTVVILDDDEGIHRLWRSRADGLKLDQRGIRLVHLATPDELRAFVADGVPAGCRFLLDYELLGFEISGLKLAEELGITAESTLVTSRYEEPGVRERSRALGIAILPKGMAGFVPIVVTKGP